MEICRGSKIFLAHREKGYLTILREKWIRRSVPVEMRIPLPGVLIPLT